MCERTKAEIARNRRMGGHQTRRIVRRTVRKGTKAGPSDFSRPSDGVSRAGGGHRAYGSNSRTPAWVEGVTSGAPKVKSVRKSGQDAGVRVRMGWLNEEANIKAALKAYAAGEPVDERYAVYCASVEYTYDK